jgi:hypothetical protein
LVARGAKTSDLTNDDRGHDGAVSEFLTRVNIRQVNLDHRDGEGCQGVADGDAVVGEGAWVDDDTARAGSKFLNSVDDDSFVIGLDVSNFEQRFNIPSKHAETLDNGVERFPAIDPWFAGSQ